MVGNSKSTLRCWPALDLHGKTILDGVSEEWVKLICDPATNERECLAFLSDDAGFFFRDMRRDWTLVVSEFRFGTDYRADFMVPVEGYSEGPTYKLIEIESPNENPYDKRGYPTRRLSDAIQQINDWRAWIEANRNLSMDQFPSAAWHHYGKAKFEYQIIIGRREHTAKWRGKLQQAAQQNGIEIRSFDYLTDKMTEIIRHGFRLHCDCESSAQLRRLEKQTSNQMANPFLSTLNDPVWRDLIRQVAFRGWLHHLVSEIADKLVDNLRCSRRLDQFDRLWSRLDENERCRIWALEEAYFGKR